MLKPNSHLNLKKPVTILSRGLLSSGLNPFYKKEHKTCISLIQSMAKQLEKFTERFQILSEVAGPLLSAKSAHISPNSRAWDFYYKYNFRRLSQECPLMNQREVTAMVALEWSQMSLADRARWPILNGFKVDSSVEKYKEFGNGTVSFESLFHDWDILSSKISILRRSIGMSVLTKKKKERLNKKGHKESTLYTLFYQDRYRQISYMNPQLTPQEITKLISIKWKRQLDILTIKNPTFRTLKKPYSRTSL